MKKVIWVSLVTSLCFSSTQSNPWGTPNLNPVHGLFVKPSDDGTTGDLYVAASEDSGVKTQWIADQAINFIPVGAATQLKPTTVPLPYPPPPPPSHKDATHKRAVMPNPPSSPPVQYAYAMPVPASAPAEGNPVAPYPYAFPVPVPFAHESSAPKCDSATNVGQYPFPYQFPYQYIYPQMMSAAYTNAMSILKDVGLSEDTASSAMASAAPMWPPTPYAYPMYVMVDPSAWSQGQASATSSTQATSSSGSSSESS